MNQMIMFTGKTCGGCKMMYPLVKGLDNAKIIDVEEDPTTAMRWQVRVELPVFILTDCKGSFINRHHGAMSPHKLQQFMAG